LNERIKQLAEQAGIDFFNSIDIENSGRQYCEAWIEQLEKFAELIVEECAEHLESSVLVPNSEHSRVKWKCIRAIKKHFGVELWG
jgi:hypothetical protein